MDPEQIENLVANLPKWATEDTLLRITYDSGKDLQTNINGVNKLANQLGLEEVTVNVLEAIHNRDLLGKKFRRNIAGVRKQIDRSFASVRSTDPIAGFSEVAELAGGAIGGVGTGVQKLTGYLGGRINAAGDIIGTVARGTGKGVSGVAALTGAMAPLVMIQEKNLRAMLDYGYSFNDGAGGMTRMRGSAARMGMGIAEMMTSTQAFNVVAANTGDGFGEQSINFNNMLAGLSNLSRQDAGFNQFGLNATQFAEQMSSTANMMYQLGELEDLSIPNRRKMIETFTNTQKVALGMADLTGISRTALLENGFTAEQNISIRGNLLRQKEFLEEKYGEDVTQQIELNATFLKQSITSLLPTLGPETEKVITAFISNITSTQEVLPSMTPELMEILALMDGPAQQDFIRMMQDSLTGQIDRQETALRVRDFANTVASSEYKAIGRNSGQAVEAQNRIISESRAITQDFRGASDAEILDRISRAGESADRADDSIEAIEGTKVALRKLQHEVSPGFQTMAVGFRSLHEALSKVGDAFKALGFIDEFESGTEIGDNLDAASLQAENLALSGGLKLPEGYGGVFDPNNLPPGYYENISGNIGLDTGRPPSRHTPTIDFNAGYEPDPDNPPLAIQDVVEQGQVGQNKFRNRPLSPTMLEVLQHAAMVVHPQMRVLVTSGGQMSLAEWEASNEPKRQVGNEYFLNGRKARKGSRRHDEGNAADFELYLDGEKLNIDNPHFVDFIQAAFALGAEGGSAGHGYMGSHRAHLDLVGTAYGGALTWSDPTQGFQAAQASGLQMQNNPGSNVWRERLVDILSSEEERLEAQADASTNTANDGTIPAVNASGPEDETTDGQSNANHQAFRYQVKDASGRVIREFDNEEDANEFARLAESTRQWREFMAGDQKPITQSDTVEPETEIVKETTEGSSDISVSAESTNVFVRSIINGETNMTREQMVEWRDEALLDLQIEKEKDSDSIDYHEINDLEDQIALLNLEISRADVSTAQANNGIVEEVSNEIVVHAVPVEDEDPVITMPAREPQGYFEERKAEIQAAVDAERARIESSESGVNEYWLSDGLGRNRSREKIAELLHEMSALVQRYNREATAEAAN